MTKKTEQTVSELANSIATESLEAILGEIRELRDGKEPIGEDRFVRIASLSHKTAMISAEQRKAEKADRDELAEMTPEVALAWIKLQPPAVRARFLRDVTALDAPVRKSVLG